MQREFDAEGSTVSIRLLGVNEIGAESDNALNCEGRDLPWLQDTMEIRARDVWQVAYRDVAILDEDNVVVAIYNLTDHDLRTPEYYAELKGMLREAAAGP